MMKKILLLILFHVIATEAFATTCTKPNDWADRICNLEISPGTRCANVEFFASYCNDDTVGCDTIAGGCFGFTPPGHWYAIPDGVNKPPRWRCRCGCFAESTIFAGLENATGKQLIETDGLNFLIEGADDRNFNSTSYFEINGISNAPDKESYFIKTASNREVILSDSHPVVVVNDDSKIIAVKAAENLSVGEFLLNADREAEKIVDIQVKKYQGNLMNFNVKSTRPENHFVLANNLWMGDQAWQETINSHSSRILYRLEILKILEARDEVK